MLPHPAAGKWGHLPYLRKKNNTEWCAACPHCGDAGHDPRNGKPDRFVIFSPQGSKIGRWRGWCRRCGHIEFLFEKNNQGPDPATIAAMEAKRKRVEAEEWRKRQNYREWLRSQNFWLNFHYDMTATQRQQWVNEGIDNTMVDLHKLGYSNGKQHRNPALTIPYFTGGTEPEHLMTMQFRIVCPDLDPWNRYRFIKGLHPCLFYPWPEDKVSGVTLVVEGAKKALVTFQEAGHIKYRGLPITIVAVPSKTVTVPMAQELKKADLVIWMLDPDAYVRQGKQQPAIKRAMELVGTDRSLMVRTTGKIDDMIRFENLGAPGLQAMLRMAMPYYPTRL